MVPDKDALLYLADVRIDELEEENEGLRQQVSDLTELLRVHGGKVTCRLEGYADVETTIDYEGRSFTDWALVAECSSCGANVLVPPEYNYVVGTCTDYLWAEYRFCPHCGARVGDTDVRIQEDQGDGEGKAL